MSTLTMPHAKDVCALCDDVPRVKDGTHYFCQCGPTSVLAELRSQGVVIPDGHWVHVFAEVKS